MGHFIRHLCGLKKKQKLSLEIQDVIHLFNIKYKILKHFKQKGPL